MFSQLLDFFSQDGDDGSGGRRRRRCASQRPKVGGRSVHREKKKVQNYESLKEECLGDGILFEDPEFPAEDSSINFSGPPDRPIEWKRPSVSRNRLQ